VQKSRLVERIAELLNDKKLPLVADVRDESADDVRLVIEPRSRTVDPEILMESLFKLTELESRIPLNMNVLVKGKIPKVVGLAEALRAWLDHRREVLLRRTNFRVKQIEARLEVLGGYLIAYLNLDEVIRIIRNEDEPKPVLIKTFKLTDVQADAILNMRLRNLRKLEEMEIKAEDRNLRTERKKLQDLVKSEKDQWKTVAEEIKALLKRHDLADAGLPVAVFVPWRGSATFRRLDAFCQGLTEGLAMILADGHPLVLAGDGDVGGLMGIHLREEMGLDNAIVSVDGLELKQFDYIDIGRMLPQSGAVPVVIKSLIFPADAAARPQRQPGDRGPIAKPLSVAQR